MARVGELAGDLLRIDFLTMPRLKSAVEVVMRPEFHILLRTLLRRVSALSYFHGGERLEADFAGLAERARRIRLLRDGTFWQEFTRYSSRQKAKMDLGGLVGEAVYEGELAEFLPWLAWGELVYVGKNVTFGLGKYRSFKTG
ncbi:MAG: CRISPR system precrRNA processing endoribonuclease RAMP protein Cas6 [Firmicutes bacterium]|nr:CRISPR system precrRNA processing endoribonuclease RAMP protein Cas6 [Bacillota bacterium]